MRKNQLSIHSENLLPIIKKWLYTDRDIFVRELVSNSTDALTKHQVLSQKSGSPEISIEIDKEKKALRFSDNGIGMTEEEVEKYIAQIAFSSAEEFLQKHKDKAPEDAVIGHFGLGFYSVYMVADRVELETLSHQEGSTPVFWTCDGSSSYEIGPGSREKRGTTVTLFLNEESLEYLEERKLRALLERYCSFLPYPIRLNETLLPREAPLWTRPPSSCTEQEYKDLHRKLSPLDSDPLFWIHLQVDTPFRLQGILYFPRGERFLQAPKSSIHLYSNRVFVADSCKDILPDYLTSLHGVIDSPDIPLNVSRSTLQVDGKVKQLSAHIAKKVADRLVQLYTTDREKYIASWSDIEPLVKLGMLQDDKFYERVKEALLWKNSKQEWTTLKEYLERAKEQKIYTGSDSRIGRWQGGASDFSTGASDSAPEHGAREVEKSEAKPTLPAPILEPRAVYYVPFDRASSLLEFYRQQNREILFTSSSLDTAMVPFLEAKLSIPFQRIDGTLDPALLDPSREKGVLDAEGRTASSKLASFIRSALEDTKVSVEAKSLASDALPAFLLLDEQERRRRDYLSLAEGRQAFIPIEKKSFVVNTNHPLIQAVEKLQERDPKASTALIQGIYSLSLLAQRELDPQGIEEVLKKQHSALEALTAALK